MSARGVRRCGASAPAGETLRRETCPRLLGISGAHLTNRSSPGGQRTFDVPDLLRLLGVSTAAVSKILRKTSA